MLRLQILVVTVPPHVDPVLVITLREVVSVRIVAGLPVVLAVNLFSEPPFTEPQASRQGRKKVARTICRQCGVIDIRRIAVVDIPPDFHGVVFDLSVVGCTCKPQPALRTEPEPGVCQTVAGSGGDIQGHCIRAARENQVSDDLFARIGPVTISVEVHPRVQVPARRGRHPQGVGVSAHFQDGPVHRPERFVC